jgi:hypothetical protein
VLPLVEPLLDKEHTLWMANFYNASVMDIKLKFMKTDCAGTLRLSRKDVPKIGKERETGNYGSAFWPSVSSEEVGWGDCHDQNISW